MKKALSFIALFLLPFLSAQSVEAKVTRVEILARADVLGGRSFGPAGPYEKIVGRVHFAVTPEEARNRAIVDLDKAPRNGAGEVEFSADLYVLRPKDPARGSGSLLLEVPNRGGKGLLRLINQAAGSLDPTKEADFGDGFLMRQGMTLVWVGWQFDVREAEGMMRLYAPVARDGAKPITGLVRSDFVVTEKTFEHPLGHIISGQTGGTEYPVSDPASPSNVLTVRDSPLGQRRIVSRGDWEFARRSEGGRAVADARWLYLRSGFEPGRIYEIVYAVQDPVVVGLGLAAVRDLTSYFKYDAG